MDQIQKRSYSPFSGISEYCLVKGQSGLIYPGVRIENSSFPLTISSMQSAISSSLANKDNPVSFWHGDHVPELLNYWVKEYGIKKNEEIREYASEMLYQPITRDLPEFSKKLKELCKQAVTPNSNFPVSAILETDQGFVEGVNIEGSSWSLGLCAERVAISRAIAAGVNNFRCMHIMAPKSNYCSPCGACRQIIHEFMPKKQIYLYHTTSQKTVHFSEHLLPNAFTATSL